MTVRYARLLVLETDVQRQDVRVFDALGHIWMSRTVVEDQTTDKLSLRCRSVLHLHNLNHV